MVTPWPQASYLQKINGRGRSHVRLRGGAALPAVELVAGLVRRGESQQPQDAAHTSAAGNRSRSNQTDLPLCLPAFALAIICQACSWQRSRHTIGADWNINKQRKPVQKIFHRRATSASKRENNSQGAQVKQPRIFADHVTDATRSHKLHWYSLLNAPESAIRRSLLSSRSTEKNKKKQ